MITMPIEHMMIFPVQGQNFKHKMVAIQMFLSLKMVDMCFTQHKTMFSLVMPII